MSGDVPAMDVSGDVPAMDVSGDDLAKGLFGRFAEFLASSKNPVFVDPVFGLDGDFEPVFGQFRGSPGGRFTSLLRFLNFRFPFYCTF